MVLPCGLRYISGCMRGRDVGDSPGFLENMALWTEGRMEKTLYHVTGKEKLSGIMQNGIIPNKGQNSRICDESDDFIYLTDSESLPYWYILTGADTVLSVDKSITDELETAGRLHQVEYSRYDEYRTQHSIPAKYLKTVAPPSEVQLLKAMHILAWGYTYSISDMCYKLLRADIVEKDAERLKVLAACTESLVSISERIDFWTHTPYGYKSMITDYSNYGCAVTFADYYYPGRPETEIRDAGKRCFEHLPNLENNILKPAGLLLHRLITRVYAKCVLYPDEIGGFCI